MDPAEVVRPDHNQEKACATKNHGEPCWAPRGKWTIYICVTNKFHFKLPVNGGPTWIRTRDQPVMSRELYQLSYGPPTIWQIIII